MSPLSLVIVTWNSAAELPGLIASIERHLPSGEVIVVDNASTDATCDVVSRWRESRLIRLSENHGFGSASNVGVRAASSPAVVLLNPDARLVDDSLLALAEFALREGVLAGPELLDELRVRQPSASPPPAGWTAGVAALVPGGLLPQALQRRCEPWRAPAVVKVGWLTGACVAAPREALLSLGPFDERISLYGEDMDLGLRAAAVGIPSVYAPNLARIIHYGGRSTAQRFLDLGVQRKLAARRAVVRRHYGQWRERYDFAAQIVFHGTRYIAKSLLRRDPNNERAWLRALSS